LQRRFEFPTPRVELGAGLRDLASACIDLSDGLLLDAQRLLRASNCRASIELERVPLSAALIETCGELAWQQGLSGGEDYELCFSAPPAQAAAIAALALRSAIPLTRIGLLEAGSGVELKLHNVVMQFAPSGFDHFQD
jgi:thiamine-monophosphate kinase